MSGGLTRVSLVFVDQRINVYLRFGRPEQKQRIGRFCSLVDFTPGTVFCRISWKGNPYGTTQWDLMVLQAGRPNQAIQRVVGIAPGAALLLHVHGSKKVPAALQLIDAIEAQRIDPADVAPSYWRTVHNRLAGSTEPAPYAPEQHAAHLLAEAFT